MHILVTGGAGFIGGYLCGNLLARGAKITVIDNFSTGSMSNIASYMDNPSFRLVEGDITRCEVLDKLVQESDAVIHLAAAVGVELVVRDPVSTIMTNVQGAEIVLSSANRHRKRIIIASTSEVYGKSRKLAFAETDDLIIGNPKNSRWSYAASKLIDEFMLLSYHRQNGLPGTVVRFFNTVGPRQTGRYGMVIPRLVSQALQNRPLQVYGDGEQTRCFCHVCDTVRALESLLDNPASYGEIYNIGSEHGISIKHLAEVIIKRTHSSSELQFVPYSEAYEAGFEDMRRRRPDTNKIRSLINWQPEHTLEKIIDDVAARFRAHPEEMS